jgi:ATP-dependent RNA helicase SUPV3L1/SUV3
MLFANAPGRLTAVLGPTNTGKTYLAIERMLGHASGMIGFPLRLLARENYDRVVKQVGAGRVALVTGEEKILPPNPSYFVCTVESMPVERQVAFLAVDEVQMAADSERGHFFTERLLSARGTEETMLLGSDTIRPVLQRLAADIEVISRPRFSTLSYTGPKKITRLPRRSAVVGFSASEVYVMAELIRRQRGGAAIVMGALSPRTRNAQVEMFQSGEVDYLVATDAIGMGLNMDVAHVCFAGTRKFDGRSQRPLTPAELAQIAGRAGRHMNDGTFGTTAEAGGFDQETVEAIENHRFDPLKVLQWRNTELDYGSVQALLTALNADPPHAALVRSREQDDQLALQTLTLNPEIADRAKSVQRVRLLWDVCQIPDFRKTMAEEHLRLLSQIFLHLASSAEQLSEDWVDAQVRQLERFEGDIDTLMGRIAHTRTWTYISHRPGWLSRAAHWQERTRSIEDRLSDALHERLTQRFVDRRAAMLVRRLKDDGEMATSVDLGGDVTVEGEYLGRIEGFRFAPDMAKGHDQRAVVSAALRALRNDMPVRLQAFASAPDGAIAIDEGFRLVWGGGPVARLSASGDILAPRIEVLTSDLLDGPAREIVRKRCSDWVEAWIGRGLPDLNTARKAEEISPAVRGVVFRICENLGVMPRAPADEQLATFTETDRKVMARLGVRVGIYSLYLSTMLKPGALRLRATLWAIANSKPVPTLPAEGRTSVELAPESDRAFYAAIGFLPLGDHAIRADMVERLSAMARQAVRDSREAHHRAQSERRAGEAAQRQAAAAAGEINEWMIVAAALGEPIGEMLSAARPEAAAPADGAAAPLEAQAAPAIVEAGPPAASATDTDDEGPIEVASPVCYAGELDVAAGATAPTDVPEQAAALEVAPSADPVAAEAPPVVATQPEAPAIDAATNDGSAATAAEPAGRSILTARPPKAKPAKPRIDLPPLPPGHFRATAEMMSLVGCSEPAMAQVLRSLGYRVHQPGEQTGPLHSFSLPPRFPREERRSARPERRERREGDRGPPRRERDDAAAPQVAAEAGAPPAGRDRRPDGGPPRRERDERRRDRPQREAAQIVAAPEARAAGDAAPAGAGQRDRRGGRGDAPPQRNRREEAAPPPGQGDKDRGKPRWEGRGPRRDAGGPAVRLVASTERSGAPSSDSPFAKLLELKFGNKK